MEAAIMPSPTRLAEVREMGRRTPWPAV